MKNKFIFASIYKSCIPLSLIFLRAFYFNFIIGKFHTYLMDFEATASSSLSPSTYKEELPVKLELMASFFLPLLRDSSSTINLSMIKENFLKPQYSLINEKKKKKISN